MMATLPQSNPAGCAMFAGRRSATQPGRPTLPIQLNHAEPHEKSYGFVEVLLGTR